MKKGSLLAISVLALAVALIFLLYKQQYTARIEQDVVLVNDGPAPWERPEAMLSIDNRITDVQGDVIVEITYPSEQFGSEYLGETKRRINLGGGISSSGFHPTGKVNISASVAHGKTVSLENVELKEGQPVSLRLTGEGFEWR